MPTQRTEEVRKQQAPEQAEQTRREVLQTVLLRDRTRERPESLLIVAGHAIKQSSPAAVAIAATAIDDR